MIKELGREMESGSRVVVKVMIIPLLVCILLLVPAAVYAHTVPAVFIFGDSLFDAGNNHYNKNCTAQADFPPYGSSFFHHPTGRFTNGRTVADFICTYVLYGVVYNICDTHTHVHTSLILRYTLYIWLFIFILIYGSLHK